ncbi:activating transcription factor 7-interacting protein 1 [Drosophila ficusphila]|uniref:activating transcription factor 7-interacting protein 1 n=1 Tax=Drosophila ficusphila TaxID=30025 RepID=UPI0007E5F3B3|nr:activating transcription factor 7-interacting protein 1 [Drosophila ficusphila]XP_017054243.1 activating transcription factor 7-interacting protein 1 [Drosophila ficusphila]XP_017054244.1 activating transcription factor 7-interacting protein 1 [Drosophila ficusphila]
MMEVSQNMELKELSTEGALMRSLSSELVSDVETLSTRAIVNESSKTSRDEDDLCELTNGVDSLKTVDKPITGSEQERNAGSDLDALLDKISSVVDCSPRNLDELETFDKNEECDSASLKEKTADEKPTELREEESLELLQSKEADSEIHTEDTREEGLETAELATDSKEKVDDLAEPEEPNIEKTTEDNVKSEEEEDCKAHAVDNNEKVKEKLNTSTDDVFMDALDSISSSDEFDGFGSQDSKKTKLGRKPNPDDKQTGNDLEEISSDDEDILRDEKVKQADETEKPKEDVIDLNSSDECMVTEVPTEGDKREVNTEKVTSEKGVVEDKEIVKENIPEVPVEDTEDDPVKANEEEEKLTEIEDTTELRPVEDKESTSVEAPEVSKEADKQKEETEAEELKDEKETEEPKELEVTEKSEAKSATTNPEEGKKTEEQEDTKEVNAPEEEKLKEKSIGDPEDEKKTEKTEELMVVEDEVSKDSNKEPKIEVEIQTQTQEVKNTLLGADKEQQEKKAAVDEPVVILEQDKAPKVNGVCEKETEDNEQGKKPTVEKEANDPESDDEVIFFEPLDKTKKVETDGNPMSEMSGKTDGKDDEVVLVSEDEDDEPQAKNPEKKPLESQEKEAATKGLSSDSTEESAAVKDLQVDNSDNACDQFEKLKTHDKVKPSSADDGNSNSSNLLRPAEDAEESVSKRMRLSTDEQMDADLETVLEAPPKSTCEEKEIAKRNHEHLDSPDREEEIPNKKPKTDDSDSNSSTDGTLQIDLDEPEDKSNVKSENSLKSEEENEAKFELKPEPQIKKDVKPLRLEFFKAFRRNFDTMTRDNLEELVLQKVVEAMLVKSEFADIRLQLDKCESTLATYRRKIAEVSKQFLDLETVHKRVLKDLEVKNMQFTAPVRITRAVGLQVGIPFKAMKPTVAAPDQPHAAGSMLAPPSGTPPKASTSPMRSPMRPKPPAPSFGPGSSSGTGPGHSTTPNPSPQQQPGRSTANTAQSTATAATATPPVRRGCLQKITPQRPGPGTISSTPPVNNQPNVQRLQGSSPGGQRTMYASKHTGTTASMTSSASNATAAAKATAMRNRNLSPAYASQKQQPQQQQQQYQTPRPGPSSGPGATPAKQTPKCTTKVRPQQPPLSGATVSVPMSSASGSGAGSAAYVQQQQPSLAPAKPKEKAVIDLTDEDDAAAAAAAAAKAAQANQAQIEANARLRQASNAAVKRTAQAAAAARGGRGGGNVVRASPMQLGRVNARQLVQNNGGGQRNSGGSNVTMQIRSENTPPSSSRLRYSHPAPLPSSPAQPFNAAWKMPPSRPVIRISLLDTGIVISWTLEDTSPRFAECVTYQIYAYQETIHEPSTESWRHVGDVHAMLLPMAVTLNQFQENQRYYFAVRGVDNHQRFGPFSVPKTWS